MALWICPNLITKKTRFFINILHSEHIFLVLGPHKGWKKNLYYLIFQGFFLSCPFSSCWLCCDMCASRSGNSVISHVMTTQFFFHIPLTLVQLKTVCFSSWFFWQSQLFLCHLPSFWSAASEDCYKNEKYCFPGECCFCIVFALNQVQLLAALFCIPAQTVNVDRIYLIENEVNDRPLNSIIFPWMLKSFTMANIDHKNQIPP